MAKVKRHPRPAPNAAARPKAADGKKPAALEARTAKRTSIKPEGNPKQSAKATLAKPKAPIAAKPKAEQTKAPRKASTPSKTKAASPKRHKSAAKSVSPSAAATQPHRPGATKGPSSKKSTPAPSSSVATGAKILVSAGASAARSGPKTELTNGRASAAAEKPTAPSKNGTKSMGNKPQSGNGTATLTVGYRPSESEPFMGAHQRLYFRTKLLMWKDDIIKQNRETLQVLHEDTFQHSDLADRATSETERALELRARDRQRKLVSKIDAAVARIEDGSYGYCEETGEPISLKRLDARPIATLSLEAQERHERREKVYRED
jgi:DnaK suppressor protein